LQQIKKEHQAKAKEFIPQLCYALQNEDAFLSNEDIRDRIKKDLIDIWSKTTIQIIFQTNLKMRLNKLQRKKQIKKGRML
jgi:hypothetical protein